MKQAIERMTARISSILADCEPSIYLYGSVVMDDFRLGWSDIDLLVLTQREMTQQQAAELLTLRQAMLYEEPDNPYYRSFEGGILPLRALTEQLPTRVVYWGTSGQRMNGGYWLDPFSRYELLTTGRLLSGADVRDALTLPTYGELRSAVRAHAETVMQHGHTTGRSLYTFGWLLDISRCLYTLQTGCVIAKTQAGEWALARGICPVPDALALALRVRRNPAKWKQDAETMAAAERLGQAIHTYARVLIDALEENE